MWIKFYVDFFNLKLQKALKFILLIYIDQFKIGVKLTSLKN